MKMTVKVVLDVDVAAWQEKYPADGLREAHDRVHGYVQQLVATSPPAGLGLWRVIRHPSGWRPSAPL